MNLIKSRYVENPIDYPKYVMNNLAHLEFAGC